MSLSTEELLAILPPIKDVIFQQRGSVEEVISKYLKGKPNAMEIFNILRKIMVTAAKAHMTPSGLEKFIRVNVRRPDLAEGFKKFWEENNQEIHGTLIRKSSFSDSLTDIKWRVDQLTNTKNVTEIADPVAIVELTKKNDEKVTFEVDRDGMTKVLEQFQKINSVLENYSK